MKLPVVFAILFCICSMAYGSNSLPELLPSPQFIKQTDSSSRLNVSAIQGFVLEKNGKKAAAGVELINTKLKELNFQSLPYLKTGKPGKSGTIWLGMQPNIYAEKLFAGFPEPGEQGYKLAVGKDWVVVLGKDLPGLYYGLETLKQLIQPDGTIPQVLISDWPDLRMRGTYIAESNPEKKIDYFASLKLNFIVFEYSDLYKVDDPAVHAHWQKIADECRRHFIEPIPELQSFGHGHFVVAIEPRCVESVYKQNVPVVANHGDIVLQDNAGPLPDISVPNSGFEQETLGGWTADNNNDAVIDKLDKCSGNSSLHIFNQSRSTLRVYQTMPCHEQAVYKLNCFIKTKDIKTGTDEFAGAYAEVYGVFDNGGLSATPLKRTVVLNGTNEWNQISCTFNTQEYNKLCIFIRLQDSSGSVWFDDIKLSGIKSEMQISPNTIITPASPIVLTDKTGNIKYKEGKDFKVIPGDPLITGDIWTGKPFYPAGGKSPSLKVIAGGRIKEGDQLLLSYNYAPTGSLSCCPSEPLYRDLMRKSIHNIVKCMKCNYVHIGHDEPQAINRDSRCTKRGLSNAQIYVDDIKRMRDYAVEANPKCRIMMWDDTLNPYSNAPGLQLEHAANNLPKDIIMNAWAYGYPGDNEKIQKSIKFWSDLGFNITGSPWYDCNNAYYWDKVMKEHKNNNHILGSFYTAWLDDKLHTWLGLTTSAQYAWSDTVSYEDFQATKK